MFFFFENRAVYEVMWKNTAEPHGPQMTIRRMHITCWITKATNTHSENVILGLFHCNNVSTNAPQRDITRTLPVFLSVPGASNYDSRLYQT